jgi:hypothetical protein
MGSDAVITMQQRAKRSDDVNSERNNKRCATGASRNGAVFIGWQVLWVVGELGALFLSRAHTAFREGEDLEAQLRSGQSSLVRRLHAAKIQRPAYAHQRESLAKFTTAVSTLLLSLSYGGACQKVLKLPVMRP